MSLNKGYFFLYLKGGVNLGDILFNSKTGEVTDIAEEDEKFYKVNSLKVLDIIVVNQIYLYYLPSHTTK